MRCWSRRLARCPFLAAAFWEAAAGDDAPKPEVLWTGDVLVRVLPDLHEEMAGMRTEIARLREENEALRASAGQVPRSGSGSAIPVAADSGGSHASTLFLTMCAGSDYFVNVCGPFLASFERAYGEEAQTHRLVTCTARVEQELVDIARRRFSPWALFEPLPRMGNMHDDIETIYDTMDTCVPDDKGDCIVPEETLETRDTKTTMDSLWFPSFVADYLKDQGKEFRYAVIMDSDVLFVRKLGPFLAGGPVASSDGVAEEEEAHATEYFAGAQDGVGHTSAIGDAADAAASRADWDVAFTVYGPDFTAPWAADAAGVGRTHGGFTRVNCGVVLLSLRNVTLAQRFLRKWVHVSAMLTRGGDGLSQEEGMPWEVFQGALLEQFRGNDQAGLALLLCSYDLALLPEVLGWGRCKVCRQPVKAELELFVGEDPLHLRFLGLPARVLNHPEAMEDGVFPPGLRIVHLKGLWWRTVLSQGNLFTWDATRRAHWHRDALLLHRLVAGTWRAALSPEVLARAAPLWPMLGGKTRFRGKLPA